jgi:hypothetical protein
MAATPPAMRPAPAMTPASTPAATPPVAAPTTPPTPAAPPAGGAAAPDPAAGGADAPAEPAECVKGEVEGSEVLIIGESFYALNNYPKISLENLAREAGALDQGEQYRQTAVVATTLASGQIPGQFDSGLRAGPVELVIMDGGGNDCMSSSCPACPGVFEELLMHMADEGVKNVIYTRYPEPGVPGRSVLEPLKSNLDVLMPLMEEVCKASVAVPCHWVDLRPVWEEGDCADGLHPTMSGGLHVAEAIWAKMEEQCIGL